MTKIGFCFVAFLAFILCACGGNSGTGDGGTDNHDSAVSDGTLPNDARDTAPSECTSNAQCDDGIDCTDDTCSSSGWCTNTLVPARCPTGTWCNPTKGCEAGKACAKDEDCDSTDACVVNNGCDPASRVCMWSVLDGDGDGQPPLVCGGTDCDDSDSDVYAGAPMRCNGKDNNCDGIVDTGTATDEWCNETYGPGHACQSGHCVCTTGTQCGYTCADLLTDKNHCGTCFNPCPLNEVCVQGQCECPSSGQTFCAVDGCVDLTSDKYNCGECEHGCWADQTCVASQCACSGNLTQCGSCVDTQTDNDNCGSCGHACSSPASCVSGQCQCPTSGQSYCDGAGCVDLQTDHDNCGTCGHACRASDTCWSGSCPAYWKNVVSNTALKLNAVWGAAPNDVWTVGNYTTGSLGGAIHWNGSSWAPMGGATSKLYGIWGTTLNFWVVGETSGYLEVWNDVSGTWEGIPNGCTTASLYGIWGTAIDDTWFVGAAGTTVYFNGSTFSCVPSGSTNVLHGVGGTANNDVWTVGDGGTILHWNGSTWSSVTSNTTNALYGVWGNTTSDVWVVGDYGTTLHWNGSVWSAVVSYTGSKLNGVWGSSANDVWAVGDVGVILHWNGSNWSTVATGTTAHFSAVWGNSATDIWVVGEAGTTLHYYTY